MANVTSKLLKTYGKAKMPNERDEILKIELREINKRVGLDIRKWYKPKDDADVEVRDEKGYAPGRNGIFLHPLLAEWAIAKLVAVAKDEVFLKTVADAKEASKLEQKEDKAAAKLAQENEELKKQLLAMQQQMKELMAAVSASKAPAAPTDTAEELEEVALPESSVAAPTKQRRKK